MNIRRCLMIIVPLILIIGSTSAILLVKAQENENFESIPVPANESPEEYQNRLWAEADILLRKDIEGMSAFEAAKYLRNESVPLHDGLFFEKVNQAIEENPTFEALMLRGEAFWSLRDDKESARKDFVRAVEINPESYKAHQELARVLGALGDLDNSIVEAKKAIELGSKDSYFIMGENYYRKGDLKESLKYYQEFDKHSPNSFAVGTIEFLKSKIAELEK